MIKLFCDLCGKEIINQDYVEQSIFNHFDFEQSTEGIFCKKCWEEQSSTSQTKSLRDFPNGEHNKDLTATQQVASPKSASQTSLNPDIKRNFGFCSKALGN